MMSSGIFCERCKPRRFSGPLAPGRKVTAACLSTVRGPGLGYLSSRTSSGHNTMPSNDDVHRCAQCGLPLPADGPASPTLPSLPLCSGTTRGTPGTWDAEATRSEARRSQCLRGLPVHPERIGPYRILQPLREGGMGIVYLAEQQEPIRRRVASSSSSSGWTAGRSSPASSRNARRSH